MTVNKLINILLDTMFTSEIEFVFEDNTEKKYIIVDILDSGFEGVEVVLKEKVRKKG
jgi:uncharacterized protein YdeI (BOF family)